VVSWGVLGTGRVADTWVAPAISVVSGSHALAVGSRENSRAQQFAADHGFARAYGSYEEVLDDRDVDAIYIATPNALHADQVIACAARGKHVLCEKPLALTAAEAERAVAACVAAGVMLEVDFQYRHHPALRAMRGLIREGAIGEITLIQAEIGGSYPLRSWRTDRRIAGMGAVLNMGVHAYDLIGWLAGEEATSTFALLRGEGELETIALTLFELQSGALAYVNANQVVEHSRADVHVDGTHGRISALDYLRLGTEGELRLLGGGREEARRFSNKDMFRDMVANFVGRIEAKTSPIASRSGVRSAELVDAIARSARTGTRVELSAMSGGDAVDLHLTASVSADVGSP